MKTTLKYNTIESFQRQPAWKKFIDTIVDGCKGLFDDHLIAEFEDGENVTKNNKSISNIKLSESNEGVVPQMDLENLRPKYSVLNYLEDGIPLTMQENISLKGLLRTLSLYGCRIRNIDFYKSALPHTYKESRDVFEVENIYGFYTDGGTTYDEPVQAIVDGNSGQNVDGVVGNNEEDITDEYKSRYKYIKNIYGYNQKHPVVSISNVKTFKEFVWYERKTDEEYRELNPNIGSGNPTGLDLIPQYLYIEKDITIESNKYYTTYYSDDNSNASVKLVSSELNVQRLGRTSSLGRQGQIVPSKNQMFTSLLLQNCYNEQEDNEVKFIDSQFAFIINDKAKDDLLNNGGYIEYNTADSENSYELLFYNDGNISSTLFTKKLDGDDNPITITMSDGKTYYVYIDDFAHQDWCIMNQADSYFNVSLPYLKNQLFAEECTLKAQPLFEYNDWRGTPYPTKMVSMCANTIDSSIQGGIDKITYEVEKYEKLKINAGIETKDNATDWTANNYVNEIIGTYKGGYFYKWEQYESNGAYKQYVYTTLKFDELKDTDYSTNENLNYFFNGYNELFPINDTDYTNNTKKVIDGYTYVNTYQLEYFETMYFNHFIKVSPIDGVVDGDTIKTTKLYCDNLELVEFGDVVPYVVSYDRKGEMESVNNEPSEIYDDIDCAIFSKILCYNKHTHLLTVDKPVYFNKYGESEPIPNKYVVVAYQNVSPFNKINDLYITAPNENVKQIVKQSLEQFVNQKCNLWIRTTEGVGGRNLLRNSTQTLSNYDSKTDGRNYIYMMFRLVPSVNSINNFVSIKGNETIDTTGRKTYTFTLPQTNGYNYLWLRHSGSSIDYSVFFELYESVAAGDTLTLSFDVDGCNPSIEGLLMVKNFKLERGNTATDWSIAPEELPYEPIE